MSLAQVQWRGKRLKGTDVTGLFGVVTGLDDELVPLGNATDLLNVDCVNGLVKPRRGYRNLIPPVTNQTTNKGFFWCRTNVSGTVYEGVLSFDKVSGTLKPYEIDYDNTTDNWSRTVITGPAAAALSLDDTYWRAFSFGGYVYAFNANQASNALYDKVNRYVLGDFDSWVPVKPPANPASPPSVTYNRNPGLRYYQKWLGAASGYATSDVSASIDGGGALTIALAGQQVRVKITAAGHLTATFNVKHDVSGGSPDPVDFTDADVFTQLVTVNDTTKIDVLLRAIKASMVSSTGPVTQELDVTVVSETKDTAQKLKSVLLQYKFGGKGTRSTWSTSTQLIVEADIAGYAADDFIFFGPLVQGGVVDWGDGIQWRVMYTYYNSTTTWESGPSLAKSLDRQAMDGDYVEGNPKFPRGTVPLLTFVNGGPESGVDKIRVYVQKLDPKSKDKKPPWRRLAEQAIGTLTLTYDMLLTDFEALSEYTADSFTYTSVYNAFVHGQIVFWLYSAATNNVRLSRYRQPIAQATDDAAFKGDLAIEDEERGANFTLPNDEPLCGVSLGPAAVIGGSRHIYVMVDAGTGLAKDFSTPRTLQVPGVFGPHCMTTMTDEDGTPIVVYLATGGDTFWKVRIPHGVTLATAEAITAEQMSTIVDGSLDVKLFGSSRNRASETAHVYFNGADDSLHLRYNARELVAKRPDVFAGKRPWQFYNYSLAQWADQWNKVLCVQWSKGWTILAARLNGAVDEFERANMKDPATGGRTYVDIDGSSMTPSSLSATVATFTDPPPWSSGTPVTVATTGNGLTAGTQYYVGRVTAVTFSFYLTQANAQAAGATGRVTLTSTTSWAAGAVTPSGPEDGAAFASDPYWESRTFKGERRRVQSVFVDKKLSTDSVDVTVYSDRQTSSAVTVASGDRYARFGPQQSGDRHRFRFTLSERHSGVRGFKTDESAISKAGQR